MPRGRVREISGHRVDVLADGWEFTSCAAGAAIDPAQIAGRRHDWLPATVPCTVAGALRAAGRWSLDGPARRFDAEDWWFRREFGADGFPGDEQIWLTMEGLATLSDIWVNGVPVLQSRGMFTAHECRLHSLQPGVNTLVIRFRSLDEALRARRGRPRWRTPMVEDQQLRHFRTTLLGRTPGWSPPAAAVGPWRPIRIECRREVDITSVQLRADADGRLVAAVRIIPLDSDAVGEVDFVIEVGSRSVRLPMTLASDAWVVDAVVPGVEPWWPHTHGDRTLYQARLEIRRGVRLTTANFGAIGFRSVSLDTDAGDFRIRVNGETVFCRGACWTPLDVVSLDNQGPVLEEAFDQLVESGMNMVRVGGTMVYETDSFLDHCDARGVMLWQDFMFANMDYPHDDQAFTDDVSAEVDQTLARLQGRPSVAILCGNSEGGQQAAMWGASRDQWAHPLFHQLLPSLTSRLCPHVPYWPSSAHGGAFPHQASAGSASYYGVGAYLRPLEDARRSEVRFASECLALANIPEEPTLARLPTPYRLRAHQAVWKARAPRDLGAGWDFDDVRDHYLHALFGVDPLAVRYADHERYLDLGRVVSGEVMAATLLEWRRARSATRGALIWFLRDLWAGAGWGVIGADGVPKAAWHYLRRALAPLAVGLTDEGGNGLAIHVVNDRPETFAGSIEVVLIHGGETRVGAATASLSVPGRRAVELNATALFDDFQDLSYAYRFGPPPHDVVVATVRDAAGAPKSRAVHFIGGWPAAREKDVGLEAHASVSGAGQRQLRVRTSRFAQSVHVDLPGCVVEDNYFHLLPGEERTLLLRRARAASSSNGRGTVRALNAERAVRVTAS